LKRLIERIGVARGDVQPLGKGGAGREAFLSEAFRPAATTDRWRDHGAASDALVGMALIEAADSREEALALAVAMREALETKAEAALITPDRALARRVAAELRRWEIAVDDSGGVALPDSDAGRFARLVAHVVAEDFAPLPLLALLRHPMNALGERRGVDALEIAVLRGPRPAAGAAGLKRALADTRAAAAENKLHWRDARARLREWQWERAIELADRLAAALDPLCRQADKGPISLVELFAAHRAALEKLGFDFSRREPADVRALAEAFERFHEAASHAEPLSLNDYADVFDQLLAGEPPVRPPFDRRARLRILGPLEARLLSCDLVLLGGLNEGTWPPETHTDAWLNRPMRRSLKLDLPERRIGLNAHDFVQAVSAARVIISRAKKQDGVETVASRFLQRLSAIAPQRAFEEARERGRRYVALSHELERAERIEPAKRPAPKPPAEARPSRLSVTEIETLIRDPYSIYARHVLKLFPLEEIDADPGAAERGTIIHDAFARFAEGFSDAMPSDALHELIERGKEAFAGLTDYPGLRAIWWPRFVRAAEWFVGRESEFRRETARTLAEQSGKIELVAGGRTFTLTARADRIDLRRDGSVAIFDYKTGQPPGLKETFIGLTPQLPLEAAIVKAGGFEGVPRDARIADIVVVRLSGGHPPGDDRSFSPEKTTGQNKTLAEKLRLASCDDLADAARAGLERLLASYAAADFPYLSIPRPKWRGRFGEYDHLARIREWSANELEEP
jgi:ATP-dependent helicase/nuclease subunit B